MNNATLFSMILDELKNALNVETLNNRCGHGGMTWNDWITYFDSELELNDYINDDNYGYNYDKRFIAFIIEFNDVNKFDYTLRFNHTYMPDTNIKVDEFQKNVTKLAGKGLFKYLSIGFAFAQIWVENAIINVVNSLNDNQDTNMSPASFIWEYFVYPSTHFKTNDFWDNVGPFLPFFMN